MFKKFAALAAAAALSLGVMTGCGASGTTADSTGYSAENPLVLTLAHGLSETHTVHIAMTQFADEVAEKTDGRIQVKIFPNGQLGPEVDIIQSILSQGGCDITFTGETMQTYEPDLGMIGMPYLIQSDEHMDKVLNGEVGQELEDLMEAAGMKCLAYYTRGPRYITSNRKITCVADCNNLVIRTPAAAMTVAAFEALGAKPTPMALAEVFTSLQQGTIEAQENPLAMIETQSFYEVCPYLILTAHLRAWVYIAMGLAQYNRLSDSQKAVVDQAGAECQAYEHELFLDNEEKYYNQLQEQGMEFIEVDTDAFAKAMIDGVLPILTDSQKKIYDAIAALA